MRICALANLKFDPAPLLHQQPERVSSLPDKPHGARRRLVGGAIEKNKLRGIAIAVGEMREKHLSGSSRGRFDRRLRRRHQKILVLVVSRA